jgi:hypothetical protein
MKNIGNSHLTTIIYIYIYYNIIKIRFVKKIIIL